MKEVEAGDQQGGGFQSSSLPASFDIYDYQAPKMPIPRVLSEFRPVPSFMDPVERPPKEDAYEMEEEEEEEEEEEGEEEEKRKKKKKVVDAVKPLPQKKKNPFAAKGKDSIGLSMKDSIFDSLQQVNREARTAAAAAPSVPAPLKRKQGNLFDFVKEKVRSFS
jgi:hypothetical protein